MSPKGRRIAFRSVTRSGDIPYPSLTHRQCPQSLRNPSSNDTASPKLSKSTFEERQKGKAKCVPNKRDRNEECRFMSVGGARTHPVSRTRQVRRRHRCPHRRPPSRPTLQPTRDHRRRQHCDRIRADVGPGYPRSGLRRLRHTDGRSACEACRGVLDVVAAARAYFLRADQ